MVFIKSIADFGNPTAIGGGFNTLAVQIYQQAIGNYDMAGAAALSIILLDISLLLFIFSKYYLERKSYITVTGKTAKERVLIDENYIRMPISFICIFSSVIIVMLYALIPLGSLVKLWGINYSFTLDHYRYAFSIGMKAIINTTIFSAIAAPITGILAMIIAYLIVRKRFLGRSFIDFTSVIGIAVPGTVVGIGYILAFNSPPVVLTGTAAIIIIAFISRTMPIGIKSGINTLQQIDPSIEEAAQDMGANSFKVFTTITLPMIKSAFLGGLIYSFIKSMTALSAVIFLISARYRLLTIVVLDQIEVGKYGTASAFSTILIVIVYIAIFIMYRVVGLLGVSKYNIKLTYYTRRISMNVSKNVILKNITKEFKGHNNEGVVKAVDNISVTINPGEFVTLLGPSGCGKTTTLRMIAGFETPTFGEIILGEKNINNQPPNKRDTAMVFQSYALFPHYTVYENIAYGLMIQKLDQKLIKDKVTNIINLVGLSGLEKRSPGQLS